MSKKMEVIGTWEQADGIEIDEVENDANAHAFEIYVEGNHVVTVYADTPEQAEKKLLAILSKRIEGE